MTRLPYPLWRTRETRVRAGLKSRAGGASLRPATGSAETGLGNGEGKMNGTAKSPMHLWIVGILSTLWNAFGCFDYLMTQTGNAAYLAMFSPEMRAYFDSYPAWMEAGWAFGVWGALAGSLLILARSRHAAAAFAVSLAGLATGTLYQYVLSSPPVDMKTGGMMAMNLAIWAVAIGLLVYALRMRRKGVLR
jgi:hypothetical protein